MVAKIKFIFNSLNKSGYKTANSLILVSNSDFNSIYSTMDQVPDGDAQNDGVSMLVEMGFPKERAEEAFAKTKSVELAAAYLLNSGESDEEWEDVEQSCKMVFVVNTDLKMSLGKTAAQVAHGCLGLYREIEQSGNQEAKDALHSWLDEGQKKIVLNGKNTEKLTELSNRASNLNIPWHLVHDAGHTEIPSGSTTVFACFGYEEDVNKVTGSLRLLK